MRESEVKAATTKIVNGTAARILFQDSQSDFSIQNWPQNSDRIQFRFQFPEGVL